MSKQMLTTVERVRNGFQLDSHITVTQLARSTSWRSDLEKFDAMQILDRNQTAAVVLTPDAFRAVMSYIDMIEEELEARQTETLLEAREHMNNWESGQELSRKAKESFLDRQERLRGLLDGDK
ncbi:hypothetical protein L1N85_15075 [Paenibacillus alkaliterrae]|uniref:hypothetical protein n=1 Tax=Paenibacillus alkaliterrae TaxID=320909 RepID=UPI001F4432CB|nr:hypothetical protein [Paenibacillus alkaliterrae]MCF2939742.1 hypothetical protein [Paenibacillus alkaliterrae]